MILISFPAPAFWITLFLLQLCRPTPTRIIWLNSFLQLFQAAFSPWKIARSFRLHSVWKGGSWLMVHAAIWSLLDSHLDSHLLNCCVIWIIACQLKISSSRRRTDLWLWDVEQSSIQYYQFSKQPWAVSFCRLIIVHAPPTRCRISL